MQATTCLEDKKRKVMDKNFQWKQKVKTAL